MCKHIHNAQVSIRAPCCKKWFDCSDCHTESETHALKKIDEMVFACKNCKKCVLADSRDYDECDEYCPYCDNHYVIEAAIPKVEFSIETEDFRVDSKVLKDPRDKSKAKSIGLP